MAEAPVLGDEDRRVDGVLDVAGTHQPQDGHQFLLDEWVRGEPVEVRRQRRQQDLDGGGHGEPCAGGQLRCLLSQGREVDLVAAPEGECSECVSLLLAEQVGTHLLEFGDRLVVDRVVDDAGLFGGTDDRCVEGLRDEDVDDGAPDVGRVVQVDGGVAGSDTECGFSGRVRQGHDLPPPVTQMKSTFGWVNRSVGDLVCGVGDDLEGAGRHAGSLGGRTEDLDAALTRTHGERRRAEHDRIAGLGGDNRLVEYRRGRVGHRGDGEHHADRLGDVDGAMLDVFVDHTDGLLVAEVMAT